MISPCPPGQCQPLHGCAVPRKWYATGVGDLFRSRIILQSHGFEAWQLPKNCIKNRQKLPLWLHFKASFASFALCINFMKKIQSRVCWKICCENPCFGQHHHLGPVSKSVGFRNGTYTCCINKTRVQDGDTNFILDEFLFSCRVRGTQRKLWKLWWKLFMILLGCFLDKSHDFTCVVFMFLPCRRRYHQLLCKSFSWG